MIHRLTEVRDDAGVLTHQMCCICFEFIPVADLFVCAHGQKWDQCQPCSEREGCPC